MSIDYVVNEIRDNCQYYLEIFDTALFRGLDKKYSFDLLSRYKNREPRSTSFEAHNKLDDLFFQSYGWRARSEGVFVDQYKDNEYGTYLYLFFPKGKFTYLWHPTIMDLLYPVDRSDFQSDWESSKNMHGYNPKAWNYYETENEWQDARNEFFGNIVDGYETSGTPKESRTEIMFNVEQYYVLYYKNVFDDQGLRDGYESDFALNVLKELNLKIL